MYPLEEFREMISSGCITNDDGTGYYATEETIFRELDCFGDIPVELEGVISYVIWFNK